MAVTLFSASYAPMLYLSSLLLIVAWLACQCVFAKVSNMMTEDHVNSIQQTRASLPLNHAAPLCLCPFVHSRKAQGKLNPEVGLGLACHSYVQPYDKDNNFLNQLEFGTLAASFIAVPSLHPYKTEQRQMDRTETNVLIFSDLCCICQAMP